MLKFHSYDIVFREIPDETTLAINIAGCPNRCAGCHSPHLQEETGQPLTGTVLSLLLERYGAAVTCVCFMGGDAEPDEVVKLARDVQNMPTLRLKTAWYSGRNNIPDGALTAFDYIKLGAYVEALGGLDAKTTNQRFYTVEKQQITDITNKFFNSNYYAKKD
ncbi:MAG: anaerobic ribonucleoside-triphosphate reductase activating protein [Tannerella sp.]|jgi:anaerobic ribonucleoside-triphosphate reductase activating protein|nr:anaerobic ribonucleoside-triphosphate reductase activating protein [Tannerella sp.]